MQRGDKTAAAAASAACGAAGAGPGGVIGFQGRAQLGAAGALIAVAVHGGHGKVVGAAVGNGGRALTGDAAVDIFDGLQKLGIQLDIIAARPAAAVHVVAGHRQPAAVGGRLPAQLDAAVKPPGALQPRGPAGQRDLQFHGRIAEQQKGFADLLIIIAAVGQQGLLGGGNGRTQFAVVLAEDGLEQGRV